MKYNFNYSWKFLLADCFPLKDATEKCRDVNGRLFYEKEYVDEGWKEVTLPHTFNDVDIFADRIKDGGSGQKRTCAFYRKWFSLPKEKKGSKILIEFEGMRQTCYLWVNGTMAGYFENGVAPFGFDITEFVSFDTDNLLAVATDNTSTRDIAFCIAETPNKPDAEPGSYLMPQDGDVPAEKKGVGYFWNCNDFNPVLGGITRPVFLHIKPLAYLTLPLYTNLQTAGTYVYGCDFDLEKGRARVHVKSELRNESPEAVNASLRVQVCNLKNEVLYTFFSGAEALCPTGKPAFRLSVTPEDAYEAEILEGGLKHYKERPEEAVLPTVSDSMNVQVIEAESEPLDLRFWNIDDPYLYRIRVELLINGEAADETVIETGFRHVRYDKDRGVVINGRSAWLTGYAQRATNEWAATGIAPEWLKDRDAEWIRESNSNHIRWMHVAAGPADIRSCDRHGIVCTQPAGDKERENFGRQWDQRVELMRDVLIAFRNNPSILFWEAGNNSINKEHMREMTLLKRRLDPCGGRFMGCRTINTEDVVAESEYTGTMLNRHAARFIAEHGPITETEYSREEAPRRVWDDFTPPDFDYRNKYIGPGGKKQTGRDYYDLTSEELAVAESRGYAEFFNDRIGGASGKDMYSAAAALCWTDSAQHGRQSFSENGRMSGRVDAARVKKQNFALYQVLQSRTPKIKIIGHWNYPGIGGDNYRYPIKAFNGQTFEETGEWGYRDPLHKTVYVAGSYDIVKMQLWINGKFFGESQEVTGSFLFTFKNVDVTQRGEIAAAGFDRDGREVARDVITTAGNEAQLRLTPFTSPQGFLADGADIAYIDVEILDEKDQICPLSDTRIDFETEGPAEFLGGYNSGRFNGYGKDDSVIHKSHVFAECGTNRVFLRSAFCAGEIKVSARTSNGLTASVTLNSVPVERSGLKGIPDGVNCAPVCYTAYPAAAPEISDDFPRIPEADALKYTPADQDYCKVLINGQEPDSLGIPSVNKNGSIWGGIQVLLDRMKPVWKDCFDYSFDAGTGCLTLTSGGNTIVAEAGRTNLLINGRESLMDGAPYISLNGRLVMEVNALIPFIEHTSCLYDDKVHVLRVNYTE